MQLLLLRLKKKDKVFSLRTINNKEISTRLVGSDLKQIRAHFNICRFLSVGRVLNIHSSSSKRLPSFARRAEPALAGWVVKPLNNIFRFTPCHDESFLVPLDPLWASIPPALHRPFPQGEKTRYFCIGGTKAPMQAEGQQVKKAKIVWLIMSVLGKSDSRENLKFQSGFYQSQGGWRRHLRQLFSPSRDQHFLLLIYRDREEKRKNNYVNNF